MVKVSQFLWLDTLLYFGDKSMTFEKALILRCDTKPCCHAPASL